MKKLIILFSPALLFFPGCKKIIGEGDVITETRSTGNFSGFDSQIPGDVYYVQGSDYKVELTAQQNILNVIETPIINNKLVIRFKNNVRVDTHEQITARITAPSISTIKLSGSGNITVAAPLVSNSLVFNLSGSGDMTLSTVATSNLEVAISGSGNISIAGGSSNTETLKISGSGNIDALKVLSKSATTNTSGSGIIKLSASENLNVTISGSGSVLYSGNPIISTSISGSGSVIHL
jgi:hypothetical protein